MRYNKLFSIPTSFGVGILLVISFWLESTGCKRPDTKAFHPGLTEAAQKGRDAVVFIYILSSDTSMYYGEKETGSGVIISEDGYIVTNYHVIAGGWVIHAKLNNNHQYEAEVIGVDSSYDIALIRIKPTGLPYLEFGDSDSLLIAEQVLSIGNPYRLHSTVTSGIVSAKDRVLELPNNAVRNFIQTDVPINHGNSGGALINARGQLVGLNVAFMSTSGAYEGFSFAIPSNMVRKIVEDLKEFGSNQKGFIGMTTREVNEEIAAEAGMSEIFGLVVDAVIAQEAADNAGIQSFDILLSLDGKKIISNSDFKDRLAMYRPGDVLLLEVLRNKKIENVEVTVGRTKE